MISSGECFRPFGILPVSFVDFYFGDSHSLWFSFRGALHSYSWLLLILGILALILIGWILDRVRISKIGKRLADRTPLSAKDFGLQYFGNSKEHAVIGTRIHQILSEESPIDVARIHPDDDLGTLEAFAFDPVADVAFVTRVEKEFGCKIRDEDAPRLRTLRQIVDYVAEQKKCGGA